MIKLILPILLFASCSSVSYKDCSSFDWHSQGIKDGEEGRRVTYFAQHTLKCAVMPDNKQYLSGREIGLEKFCTLEGGIKEGRSGQIYFDQCKGKTDESNFKKGYELGKKIYRQQQKIEGLETELSDLKKASLYNKVPQEIYDMNDKEAGLISEIKLEKAHLQKLIKEAYDKVNEQN
jgi:hypothetical protein